LFLFKFITKVSFQLYSLGYKINQYDGAYLQKLLIKAGYSFSNNPNFVIINRLLKSDFER